MAERKARDTKARFRCTGCVAEDHGKPLYGVAFCEGGEGYDGLLASVGANRATVYRLADAGGLEVLQVYEDEDKEEELYALAWAVDVPSGEPLLATGGVRGVIKVINTARQAVTRVLLGHGAMINELTWHPVAPSLLLSASKDESVRLWNVATQVCIAVFAGEAGHRDDVLSVAVHPLGNCFASAGMDNTVKVWGLDTPEVTAAVEASYSFKPEGSSVFGSVFQQFPAFSSANVHVDYVDWVAWVGHMLLSKSTDSRLILWAPDTSTAKDAVVVFAEYAMPDAHVWFVRGGVSPDGSLVACGNQTSQVHVWEVFPPDVLAAGGASDVASALEPPGFATPDTPAPSAASLAEEAVAGLTLEPAPYAALRLAPSEGARTTIRGCCFSPDGTALVAVCDNGTVWRWDLLEPRPPPSLEEVVGSAAETAFATATLAELTAALPPAVPPAP